ncbi:MAG: phosphoserine transaminase [Sphaerochaetaceae bacterium]|jgi:phosphoserine aminotransferase
MSRKRNFYAGPSTMPLEVLETLQQEFVDFQGNGLSLIEASHRGEPFESFYFETLEKVRSIMEIPKEYEVFFLGGGATLQFAMIPLNFLPKRGVADYINSGTWSLKAAKDAQKVGNINYYYDGSSSNFAFLPEVDSVTPSAQSEYLYLCSNETTGGLQWQDFPDTKDVPLIADISSDLMSRPIPIERFSLLFAGVQKNIGPSGATLVILKKEMLERQQRELPGYLDYKVHVKNEGLYNTPPVFNIWAVRRVLDWIEKHGGTKGMAQRAEKKSSLLYHAIEASGGFYHCHVNADYRSKMNIVFRLPSEELEKKFLTEAKEANMVGLKGHRSVGGMRASLYNSLPIEDVEELVSLMKEFQRVNG